MEWQHIPVFSLPPVNNYNCEQIETLIERHAKDGWEFVALLPGQDHEVAEHRKAPIALFRRQGT